MVKLSDAELKVMEVLWKHGEVPANIVTKTLKDEIGWNINTTYTIINKLVDKGAILKKARTIRKTICCPLITKEDVQQAELEELVSKVFDGSTQSLFSTLAKREDIPKDVSEKLREMIKQIR
ncbi:BlaI/MecI/CopY family transcriptional regulator [Hominicoprocola fusiformis]|uniref:BlaI/MecI/CopY family transcriptional regulator n=1 Tax=Flavonifractor plautii TaxID=292800 RepID=UPI0024B90672|nr:BlaI/MecI/CopY family transcriptional regulator [Flavonifractor plautii]MCC2172602.1 BlaI/MecI/CopY family transcriptional regulator [Hominicoprocola fusiformis]